MGGSVKNKEYHFHKWLVKLLKSIWSKGDIKRSHQHRKLRRSRVHWKNAKLGIKRYKRVNKTRKCENLNRCTIISIHKGGVQISRRMRFIYIEMWKWWVERKCSIVKCESNVVYIKLWMTGLKKKLTHDEVSKKKNKH